MDTNLTALMDDFITTKQTEGLSARTIRWYRWMLGKFAGSPDDPTLPELSVGHARDFIGSLQAVDRYVMTYRPESARPELFLSDDGSALTYNARKLIILRLRDKAGISRLHLHLFRHTFAFKYLMAGGDIMSLKRMLGHADISTTQVYLKLADRDVQAQHAKFSPVDRLGIGDQKRRRGRRQRANRN